MHKRSRSLRLPHLPHWKPALYSFSNRVQWWCCRVVQSLIRSESGLERWHPLAVVLVGMLAIQYYILYSHILWQPHRARSHMHWQVGW